jgi:plasmid stability protein
MGINLSIKGVDPETVETLKARAKRNHRSLQGELMAILEEATNATPARKSTVREISERVRSLGLSSQNESTRMIREDRDR